MTRRKPPHHTLTRTLGAFKSLDVSGAASSSVVVYFPEAAVAKEIVVLQRCCLFEGRQKPDLTSFLLDIEDRQGNESLVR